MLVVTRRIEERVLIGDPSTEPLIKIQVIRAGPGWVRLAIEAPTDLQVHREEVWERIRLEGEKPKR